MHARLRLISSRHEEILGIWDRVESADHRDKKRMLGDTEEDSPWRAQNKHGADM